jgi:hypothetical protein
MDETFRGCCDEREGEIDHLRAENETLRKRVAELETHLEITKGISAMRHELTDPRWRTIVQHFVWAVEDRARAALNPSPAGRED